MPVFESINPADGSRIHQAAILDQEGIEQSLSLAARQSLLWRQSAFAERSALLLSVAARLEQQREQLAGLITAEMGKLINESRAEVDKCVWVCRYYAEHAEAFLADEQVVTEACQSLVAFQPLGVVLAVMPWNFPLWQVFRFAAPALAAGNVCLLKHASNVMACSAAIEDIFLQAGADAGLFSHLPVQAGQVAGLIRDHRVAAVTLTGSESAGRAVASAAGQSLKKSVLELGGSDPFIVLEDADLELAVKKAVVSRYMNAGQSCIAAKRFIVVESVADDFEQRLAEAVSGLKTGNPGDEATTLAPMARDDLRQEIHEQVTDALSKGARLLAGGQTVEGDGFFYQPAVLADIRADMRAYREELFGPVASILRVRDEQQAVQVANDTEFGLGGSIWTQDRERGLSLARQLQCGCAFVNELVKSDPRLPFGGIKTSGYGRELSLRGIQEFVNVKTIWVD